MAIQALLGRLALGAGIRGAIGRAASSASGRYDATLSHTNMYEVLRELKKIDDEYYKNFRRNAKEIAKPVQAQIKDGINTMGTKMNPPLSGMRQVHFGRVAWGSTWAGEYSKSKPKPADSALIDVPPVRKQNKAGRRAIARVKVGSPGTVLADMAGSSNKFTNKYNITRPYDYMYTIKGQKIPGKRQHAITTQGRVFIAKLGGAGRRSTVWVYAERALPEARRKMDRLISQVNAVVSAKMRVRS